MQYNITSYIPAVLCNIYTENATCGRYNTNVDMMLLILHKGKNLTMQLTHIEDDNYIITETPAYT